MAALTASAAMAVGAEKRPLSTSYFGLTEAHTWHRATLIALDGEQLKVEVQKTWGASSKLKSSTQQFVLTKPVARQPWFWADKDRESLKAGSLVIVVEGGAGTFVAPWSAAFERTSFALNELATYRQNTSETLSHDLASFDLFDHAFSVLRERKVLSWSALSHAAAAMGERADPIRVAINRLIDANDDATMRRLLDELTGMQNGAWIDREPPKFEATQLQQIHVVLEELMVRLPKNMVAPVLAVQEVELLGASEAMPTMTPVFAVMNAVLHAVSVPSDDEHRAMMQLVRTLASLRAQALPKELFERVTVWLGEDASARLVRKLLAMAVNENPLSTTATERASQAVDWLVAHRHLLTRHDLIRSSASSAGAAALRPVMAKLFWAVIDDPVYLDELQAALNSYNREVATTTPDEAFVQLRQAASSADPSTVAAVAAPSLFSKIFEEGKTAPALNALGERLATQTRAASTNTPSCFDWKQSGKTASAVCTGDENVRATAEERNGSWVIVSLTYK